MLYLSAFSVLSLSVIYFNVALFLSLHPIVVSPTGSDCLFIKSKTADKSKQEAKGNDFLE